MNLCITFCLTRRCSFSIVFKLLFVPLLILWYRKGIQLGKLLFRLSFRMNPFPFGVKIEKQVRLWISFESNDLRTFLFMINKLCRRSFCCYSLLCSNLRGSLYVVEECEREEKRGTVFILGQRLPGPNSSSLYSIDFFFSPFSLLSLLS